MNQVFLGKQSLGGKHSQGTGILRPGEVKGSCRLQVTEAFLRL
jgi:hypothetical protein